MPFVSLAQEGFLHAHPEKFGKKKLAEFDAATKGKHLPEHVKHYEKGGTVTSTGLAVVHKGEKVVPARGAPADFGGRVIPNPKNVKPMWDTESHPTGKLSPQSTGARGDITTPEDQRNPIRSFKHGTDYVPSTGLAILHKGEKVIPKKDNSMAHADWRDGVTGKDRKPKKEIKRMIHEKSHNGGHIVTHEHHHPEHHADEKHTFSNLAEVAAHMEKHAGTPNEGETPDTSAAPMTAAPSPAPAPEAGAAPAVPGM